MKKMIYLILCLMSLSQLAFAGQAPSLRGKVVNQEQLAVEGASVFLISGTSKAILKSAITNNRGEFELLNVPKGSFRVEVSAVSYATSTSDLIEILDQSKTMSPIVLVAESHTIAEVEVKAALPTLQNKNGRLVMNVENSTISAGNNALEVLKRAPGVDVDKDGNISLMGQQGVNVMIDGRQTYMSGEQLATFLKNTDGSQIKNIELSTTRSAKDDAEGAAGLINIVLKKNRMEGFNGSFVASAAQGRKFRGNSSLNLNYKKNKTTVFSSYSYTDDSFERELTLERIIPGSSQNTAFDQRAVFASRDRTQAYRVGVEQKTSDRNTLMFQFNGANNKELTDNDSETLMGPRFGQVDSVMDAMSVQKDLYNRYSFNINNELLIDTTGKKLTTDLDYSFYITSAFTNYDYLTSVLASSALNKEEYERSNSGVDIKILAAKLDYTQKLWKGNIETGLKYSHVLSDNSIRFDNFIQNIWEENTQRSNLFDYIEQITAGYFDYSTERNKWGIKAGLRAEYTLSEGNSPTENKKVKRDYVDFFPSATLSYDLHENHIFTLSYARKISRPNYRHLNPFEYYIDKRTFNKGNPYLNPQYTDGFSLNYTLLKMFNITFGHDITNDAMVESVGQDSVLKTTWITRENLGKQTTSYLNLTIPFRLGKVWSMYNNITGIYMHFKGPVAGHQVSQGSKFIQANSTNNFKITDQIGAEISMRYNTKFIYNVYSIQQRFNTDLGFNYNFKDQRSSLKLAVTDIFHSNHNNVFLNFHEFDSKIYQYDDNQSVRLTFNYKFGNLKQAIRRKDTGSDEKSRAM